MIITEFIKARLDEEERLAEAASPGPWRFDADWSEIRASDDITVCEAFALSGNQLRNTAAHIIAHDPKAVLRDIETRRAMLRDAAAWTHYICDDSWYTCRASPEADGGEYGYDPEDPRECNCGDDDRRKQLHRRLAAPYAAHPDYDPKWSPR